MQKADDIALWIVCDVVFVRIGFLQKYRKIARPVVNGDDGKKRIFIDGNKKEYNTA